MVLTSWVVVGARMGAMVANEILGCSDEDVANVEDVDEEEEVEDDDEEVDASIVLDGAWRPISR